MFKAALQLLRQAYTYQNDTGRSAWDFAVEIALLEKSGLSLNDLRWLVCKGLVEHQREITPPGDDTRLFRITGALSFAKRSCFILTPAGVKFTDEISHGELPKVHRSPNGSANGNGSAKDSPNGSAAKFARSSPKWDRDRHELRVGDQVIKRFKRPAVNQETILATFEDDGWPSRIDDPLPSLAEQDPKQRLHDTIKCLNRSQKLHLIHFQGDGTGEGVLWEYTDELPNGVQ